MEMQLTPESLEALQTDSRLRCLYRKKFILDTRHPQPVKVWACGLLKSVSSALLKLGERDEAASNAEALVIQLRRKHILVCFDILLEDDKAQTRRDATRSNELPIYEIYEVGTTLHMRRNASLDSQVNAEYKRLQGCDKAGPPYFYDIKNPPVYEDGRLLEGFRYGEGTEDDKKA